MTKSWFYHKGLTQAEATALVSDYKKRRRTAESELDYTTNTWTVKVWLPESDHLPRSRIAGSSMWGLS